MKKIVSFLTLILAFTTAFAQQPTSNLYMQTNSLPPYAVGSRIGAVLTYGYKHAAVPSSGHDTLKVATKVNFATIEFDSVNGNHASPFVIMADSVGDTASYSNYPTGKAKVWYKKNPFIANYQCDEIHFIFHGNTQSYSTVKFGALFNVAVGLNAGDTLHINKYVKSTGAGGAIAKFQYDYNINQWVYTGSITW